MPTYVSEYDGVDVAIGFMNLNGIANYLGKNIDYEYILIDTDNPQTFNSFILQNSKINFFVTSYDEFELQRGLEIILATRTQLQLTKLIISSDLNNKHEEYLNHLFENFPVAWNQLKVEFTDLDVDRRMTLINQLIKQIKLRGYSSTYKDSLEYLTSLILEGVIEQSAIRKIIRKK